jgi:DNA repair exonuclease SbcCD nuclease subunit
MKPQSYTALYISDIHMSNRLPYAVPTKDGLTDRLEDQIRLWEHVAKSAIEYKAKAIYVLGDLFDKALVDPVTLTVTVRCIVGLPVPVYILPGNHDANSVRGGRFVVEAFGAMDKPTIFAMATGVAIEPTSWLRLWPLAYGTPEASMDALRGIREHLDGSKQNVLLCHHSITGCHHFGWTCPDGLDAGEVCEGFQTVLSGHFHEHQRFGPELEGMYLGAPMHHKYDDAGRGASYWIIRFTEGAAPKMREIKPGLPRFHLIKSADGEVPADAAPGDFVRWRIKMPPDAWALARAGVVERVEAARRAGLRADFRYKPVPVVEARLASEGAAEDVTKPASLEEQIARYVKHASPEALDHATLARMGQELLAEARRA